MLENIDCTIWVPVTGDISPANLNFTTRTHTYGQVSGMESYGFPIYGDALIQKSDPETGETASMTDEDLAFMKILTGEVDVNPRCRCSCYYRYKPAIPVYLVTHGLGEPRLVQVPEDTPENELLNAAFLHGQNDFQPQSGPSVSVGDVIKLPDGSLHRVMFAGFKRLPDDYNPLTLTGQDAWKDGYNFDA
jgi:hypothetical protein